MSGAWRAEPSGVLGLVHRLFPDRLTAADRLLRLALAGVFLAAAVGKIADPRGLAAIIQSYRILPAPLVNPAAIVLPWLELVLGLLLIAGRLLPGALLLANALFLTFLAALAASMLRGIDVACGCFSTSGPSLPMSWYLVRDGAFVALALSAAWIYRTRLRRGLDG